MEYCFLAWETLAYPPAQGEFAVYTIDDLNSGINYAVKMVLLFLLWTDGFKRNNSIFEYNACSYKFWTTTKQKWN